MTTLRRYQLGREEYLLLSGELRYDAATGYLDLYTEDDLPELLDTESQALVDQFDRLLYFLPQVEEHGFINTVLTRMNGKSWRKPYFDLGCSIMAPGLSGTMTRSISWGGHCYFYPTWERRSDSIYHTEERRHYSPINVSISRVPSPQDKLYHRLGLTLEERENAYCKATEIYQNIENHSLTWEKPFDQPKGWQYQPGQEDARKHRYVKGINYFCPLAESRYESIIAS